MVLNDAIENYLEECGNLAKKSREWYTQKLRAFGAWAAANDVDLNGINNRVCVSFANYLRTLPGCKHGTTLSSYTVAGYIQVIKGFVTWCSNDDEYEQYIGARTPARIKKPSVDETIIESFTKDHLVRLYRAAEKEYNPYLVERDKTILDVFLNTGIRSGELCRLTIRNVFASPGDPHIRVYGKGRKWREVGLPVENTIDGTRKNTRRMLQSFINRYRSDAPKGDAVFVSRCGKPLTTDGIAQLFSRLNTWAGGLEGVRCSAHTCRHTFAIECIRKGMSIYDLSTLLGHSSVKVTERYLQSEQAHEARKRQS